jgi:NADPH2:quinone reductase
MKAVVIEKFGSPATATVRDLSLPEPGEGQMLIDVAYAPVNFVDSLVLTGKYQFLPNLPFTPGKGPVGTVLALGPSVTEFAVGDRVLTMAEYGGYAEQALVPTQQSYRLPDALSFQDAASMSLAYDTAWVTIVERGRLKAGETVLVLGATGAVGNAALQLAKARGAKTIAAVSNINKAAAVRAAGADAVVDLSQPDLRESLRQQVYAETDGLGVDLVVDTVGGYVFDAALRCIAWRGRLVVVGFAAGRIPTVKANYLMLKNIEVSGMQISDYRKHMPDLVREGFAEIFKLAVDGQLHPLPVTFYSLEDFAQALEDVVNRKVSGRALLRLKTK